MPQAAPVLASPKIRRFIPNRTSKIQTRVAVV
jgi:hypothetical protein